MQSVAFLDSERLKKSAIKPETQIFPSAKKCTFAISRTYNTLGTPLLSRCIRGVYSSVHTIRYMATALRPDLQKCQRYVLLQLAELFEIAFLVLSAYGFVKSRLWKSKSKSGT